MIRKIGSDEVELIQNLAKATWPDTFKEILSLEQIDYMLEMMYSVDKLKFQLENGHEFYIYDKDGSPVGFVGIEPNYENEKVLKIHKLYILPSVQGAGLGKLFIDFCRERGEDLHQEKLTLNVNRFNKAVGFYQNIGFRVTKEEDIDIGHGYLMEDYVMEFSLL